LKSRFLGVPFDQSVYGIGNVVVHFNRRVPPLGDAWEADDDCAVFGRVDLPVLVVDGERLALSVADLSVLVVVGFRLSDGLVLDGRVEVVVDGKARLSRFMPTLPASRGGFPLGERLQKIYDS